MAATTSSVCQRCSTPDTHPVTRLPSLGPHGEGWVLLQFVLLGLVALGGVRMESQPDGPIAWALVLLGLVMAIGGFTLVVRGLRDLGRNLTPVPYPRDGAELVETGVYRRVRHPIYGGLIAMAVAWGLMNASLLTLLLAAVLALFFDLKSRREEAWLQARYGRYAEYMQRTHRFFPRLH